MFELLHDIFFFYYFLHVVSKLLSNHTQMLEPPADYSLQVLAQYLWPAQMHYTQILFFFLTLLDLFLFFSCVDGG